MILFPVFSPPHPHAQAIKDLKRFRDRGSLKGIPPERKREMGALMNTFWPLDLPRCGFRILVQNNEENARPVVIDEVIKNILADRKWEPQAAERAIDQMLSEETVCGEAYVV